MRRLKRVYEVLQIADRVGTKWVVLLFFVTGFCTGDILSLASRYWGIIAIILALVGIYASWEMVKFKVEEAYLEIYFTLKRIKELEEENN